MLEFEQPLSPRSCLPQGGTNSDSSSAHSTNTGDTAEATASVSKQEPQEQEVNVQAAYSTKAGDNRDDSEEHRHYPYKQRHTNLGGPPGLPMLSRILPSAADLMCSALPQAAEAGCSGGAGGASVPAKSPAQMEAGEPEERIPEASNIATRAKRALDAISDNEDDESEKGQVV